MKTFNVINLDISVRRTFNSPIIHRATNIIAATQLILQQPIQILQKAEPQSGANLCSSQHHFLT
ncbi:MAG: hypothetical protein PHO94_01680 [Petrimonas sp.]|nr:hypothetical protein [Petrimonas sp.]